MTDDNFLDDLIARQKENTHRVLLPTCRWPARIYKDTKQIYPLTIIAARYQGTYEGGRYIAFPLDREDIPSAVTGDDVTCMDYFSETSADYRGLGSTVEEAYEDLAQKLLALPAYEPPRSGVNVLDLGRLD